MTAQQLGSIRVNIDEAVFVSLCPCIHWMHHSDMITFSQRNEMIKVIPGACLDHLELWYVVCYTWPRTALGVQQRIEFCRIQEELCASSI